MTTHRRNHRIFQMMTELEIVEQLLGEWGITFTEKIRDEYKKRKFRVQYAETDFEFINRLLEDSGITYYFDPTDPASTLVLDDAPHKNDPRAPLPFRDSPTLKMDTPAVTRIVRSINTSGPGKYTVKDHDYRKPPPYPLMKSAQGGLAPEAALELFHYVPRRPVVQAGRRRRHADRR